MHSDPLAAMTDSPPDGDRRPRSIGDDSLRPGTVVLGSFRILRSLAAGAAGVALLAEQLGTDRLAVVKIPHLHLLDSEDGETMRTRFAAELRASTRVSHPHVATVYMAGEHEGVPVLAMEYVAGQPLSTVLQALAPLNSSWLGRLGLQIASALAAVHDAGIIHRDVTPRNIMVNSEKAGSERHVLLDFGVAKIKGLASSTLGPLGTPRYMPKEQVHGRSVPSSDIFGLGATLWWAITGREYLSELEEVHHVLLHQAVQSAPLDPRVLRPELPDELADLISQMLHPEYSRRPTASEFLREWPRLISRWRPSIHPPSRSWARPARGDSDGGDGGEDPADGARTEPHTIEPYTVDIASMLEQLPDDPLADDITLADGITDIDAVAVRVDDDTEPESESFDISPRVADPLAPTRFPGLVDSPALRNAIEQFVGIIPECIQDLHEANQRRDTQAVFHICRRIGDHARLVRAKHLSRLTRILRQLAADGRWEQATGFVPAIESEFHEVFRSLLRDYGTR